MSNFIALYFAIGLIVFALVYTGIEINNETHRLGDLLSVIFWPIILVVAIGIRVHNEKNSR
ncbi:hypothetical protein HYS94_02135 [Candidatus Daviesbacteria bacterium]|nr:hypothetical protein [Candidatus Daviesbacteria bacterium]